VVYRDVVIESAYRMDFVVEGQVVVELKAMPEVLPVHAAQVLSCLRFSHLHKGLLINFNVHLLKNGIRRFIL
jgi:GxxExxY protein